MIRPAPRSTLFPYTALFRSPFGLVIVKVRVLTPPTLIGLGANAFPILGTARPETPSLPVFPVPPLVEETFPLVLSFDPLLVAVTPPPTPPLPPPPPHPPPQI